MADKTKTSQELDREAQARLYEMFNQGDYVGSDLQKTSLAASESAQTQYAQNLQKTQQTALDAIRRANASAIASGANTGLSAANQLSSILGLQQDSQASALELANAYRNDQTENLKWLSDSYQAAIQRGSELTAAEAAQASGQAELMGQYGAASETAKASIDAKLASLSKAQLAGVEGKAYNRAKELYSLSQTATTPEERKKYLDEANALVENPTQFVLKPNKDPNNDPNKEPNKEPEDSVKTSISNNLDAVMLDMVNRDPHAPQNTSHLVIPKSIISDDNNLHLNGVRYFLKEDGTFSTNNRYIIKDLALEVKNALKYGAISTDEAEAFYNSVYANSPEESCIVGTTLIHMADGTCKCAKDLKAGDKVLSFNGVEWVTVKLYTPLKHKAELKEVYTLLFSNGYGVSIVDGHGFCLASPRKFIALTPKNIKKYIGKKFIDIEGKEVSLDGFIKSYTNEPLYSPIAHKYITLGTNYMLSTAHHTEFIVNARMEKPNYKKTIYYEELPKCCKDFVNEELFEAFDGEMFKAWEGKHKLKDLVESLSNAE